MKVIHKKLNGGKTLRMTAVDTAEIIKEKLKNEEMLETHNSQIDVYKLATKQIVDRQYLHFADAVAFGKEIKAEFPELGFRIIQIVD